MGDFFGDKMSQQLHEIGVDFSKFEFSDYWNGEQNILKPQLVGMGFAGIKFYDGERDSFGPLSRVVQCIDKEGKRTEFWYG